jgi:hypothetical protein
MTSIRTIIVLAGVLSLAACSTTKVSQQQVLDDTGKLGAMLQTVAVSTSAFQQQRDKVAVASQQQRNNLLELALLQESDVARSTLGWKVAGQTERLRILETLRTDIGALAASDEEQRAQARQRAAALAKTRSAVSIGTANIGEAARKLAGLGEESSNADQLKFLIGIVKEVRKDIQADNEAAAKEQADSATEQQGGKP